jgi:hypothetical protein
MECSQEGFSRYDGAWNAHRRAARYDTRYDGV